MLSRLFLVNNFSLPKYYTVRMKITILLNSAYIFFVTIINIIDLAVVQIYKKNEKFKINKSFVTVENRGTKDYVIRQ